MCKMLMVQTCRPHWERWKKSEKIICWEPQITYIWIYDCKLYNKGKEVHLGFRTSEHI